MTTKEFKPLSIRILWTSESKNTKTGNIPTGWIGETQKECKDSCKASGCPLIPKSDGGKGGKVGRLNLKSCYAYRGRVGQALRSIQKAYARLKQEGEGKHTRYHLNNALDNSRRSARVVRLSAIGNVGVIPKEEADRIAKTVKDKGMGLLCYVAGYRLASQWKDYALASTYTLKMADKAIRKGWRPVSILPSDYQGEVFETEDKNIAMGCLAQTTEGAVDCNQCGLCVRQWSPVEQLKRLNAMGHVSDTDLERVSKHPQGESLIVVFKSHN